MEAHPDLVALRRCDFAGSKALDGVEREDFVRLSELTFCQDHLLHGDFGNAVDSADEQLLFRLAVLRGIVEYVIQILHIVVSQNRLIGVLHVLHQTADIAFNRPDFCCRYLDHRLSFRD